MGIWKIASHSWPLNGNRLVVIEGFVAVPFMGEGNGVGGCDGNGFLCAFLMWP